MKGSDFAQTLVRGAECRFLLHGRSEDGTPLYAPAPVLVHYVFFSHKPRAACLTTNRLVWVRYLYTCAPPTAATRLHQKRH